MRRRVARNEDGYRIGEDHQNCTIPDAIVVQIRDLHERAVTPMSAYQIARVLGLSVNTVKKIAYYQRRQFVRPRI